MSFLRKHGAWLLVGLTVLVVLVVRIRLRDIPLERDEGEYAYAGQLILKGIPPYKFAYNMKLPGTYAAYALIMAIFGQSPAGIHIGLALVNGASVILVFLIGRRLLDDTTGVVAAATFGLLSMNSLGLGLAAHATHFVVLPALGGILILTRRTLGVRSVECGVRSADCAVLSRLRSKASADQVAEGDIDRSAPPERTSGKDLISTGLQPGGSGRPGVRTASAVSAGSDKPLKRLESPPAAHTGLKPGVNEKVPVATKTPRLTETGSDRNRSGVQSWRVFLPTRRREPPAPVHLSGWTLFFTGLLFGLATVMKQHGALFGLFGLMYLGWIFAEPHLFKSADAQYAARKPRSWKHKRNRRRSAARAAQPSAAPQTRKSLIAQHTRPDDEPIKTSPAASATPDSSPKPSASSAQAQRLPASKGETPLPMDLRSGEREIPLTMNLERLGQKEIPLTPTPLPKGEGRSRADASEVATAGEPPKTVASPDERAQSRPVSSPASTVSTPPFRTPKSALRTLMVFAAGLFLPYLLTCFVLWLAGLFPQFMFWTVSYARQYASAIPAKYAPQMCLIMLHSVVGPNLALWLLAALGAVVIWWEHRLPGRGRFLLLALFVCSAVAVSLGFYFREHYFILLLPAIALFAGIAVSRALLLLRPSSPGRISRSLLISTGLKPSVNEKRKTVSGPPALELFVAVPALLLFVIGIAASFIGNGSVWFAPNADIAGLRIYATTVFGDAKTAADYIRANSPKDARIAVVGSEPEIYFYAHRLSATGYIYTYPLVETQPYASRMQDEMIDEIERAKPEYVVFVDNPLSWLPHPGCDQHVFQWWNQYWATNLELVSTIKTRQGPQLREESSEVPDLLGEQKNALLVLKRKQASANAAGIR